MTSLSQLTAHPHSFESCCLGLSTRLLDTISRYIPERARVLSIGSGSGLLEAYLEQARPDIIVEGVEVRCADAEVGVEPDLDSRSSDGDDGDTAASLVLKPSMNRFLPNDRMHVVSGSWELCPHAETVDVWLFVYPRQPALISSYVRLYGRGKVNAILWMGPRSDWPTFQGCFGSGSERDVWDQEEITDAGVMTYETVVVLQRRQMPRVAATSGRSENLNLSRELLQHQI